MNSLDLAIEFVMIDIGKILSEGPMLSAGELASRLQASEHNVRLAIDRLGNLVQKSDSGLFSMMPKPRVETGREALEWFRRLRQGGYRCVARRVSEHGSDGVGRTVRAYRLRKTIVHGKYADTVYDFLFCFGDRSEGPSARLSGPYRPDATLVYGGGFWERVTL